MKNHVTQEIKRFQKIVSSVDLTALQKSFLELYSEVNFSVEGRLRFNHDQRMRYGNLIETLRYRGHFWRIDPATNQWQVEAHLGDFDWESADPHDYFTFDEHDE